MILLALALLAAPPPSLPRGRLAFTISGGVILGSYEAGLTWATDLPSRRPDWLAVAAWRRLEDGCAAAASRRGPHRSWP